MKEKQGILGRISLSNRVSVSGGGEEMNRMTRRRGSKASKGKSGSNPFEGRGMEQFNQVYSELEAMRATIAAREGVSTSDVWFMRGTTKGKDWVPVVVGKPSSRVSSPERRNVADPEESTSPTSLEASALHEGAVAQCPSRLSLKTEQIIYDLQQGARKALKAVTLFVMIVAAVADVLVALVAGFASSFIAKHLRSFWARFLPPNFMQQPKPNYGDLDFVFPLPSPVFPCASAPTSPRKQQDVESIKASIKSTTSASTPVSPVTPLPTFFNSRGHQAEQPASPRQPQRQQQQQRIDRSKQHNLQNNSTQQLSDGTPIMVIVLVILFSLSVGRITAALLASMAWFLFPSLKMFAGSSNARRIGSHAAGALRKQRSFIKK